MILLNVSFNYELHTIQVKSSVDENISDIELQAFAFVIQEIENMNNDYIHRIMNKPLFMSFISELQKICNDAYSKYMVNFEIEYDYFEKRCTC